MKKLSLFIALLILPIVLYGYTHFKAPAAWEDLRFPAVGINPAGITNAAVNDTTDGLLNFSGTVDNVIVMQAQMPHGWLNNSEISPHLHLLNSGDATGTTRWRLEWKIADVMDNFPSDWASETITCVLPNSSSTHRLYTFAHIDMTGKQDSCMILLKLTRLAQSDAADDYASIVKLIEFDIHYKQEAFGSINETGETN